MKIHPLVVVAVAAVLMTPAGFRRTAAQTAAQTELERGRARWGERLSKSAIVALEVVAKDRSTAPSIEVIERATDIGARAQADPAPYLASAQVLIDRGPYDKAFAWAERGVNVSDRFVEEHDSGPGRRKARTHAAARLGGAAAVVAGHRRHEPDLHGCELAQAQKIPARAKDHYLDALLLSGGPAPLGKKATEALATIQHNPAGFDASMLKGELVLLDIFASWCRS